MIVPLHALFGSALLFAAPDLASGSPDSSYGRIDGDMGLVAGVGVAAGPRGARAATDLRLRYLDTVGAFVTYEDGPLLGGGTDPRRVLATGLELRPFFLARWLAGRELGIPRLDLTIDSVGLELGAFFSQPNGAAFGARPGFQAGLGIELPMFARASGLWIGLHGGARWSDAALAGDVLRGPSDRALFLSMTLAWHQIFGAHVVDVNDRSPR